MSSLAPFLNVISRIGADPKDSDEIGLQKSLLVSLTLTCIVAGTVWGLVYIAIGATTAGTIPLLYAVASLASTLLFLVIRHLGLYRFTQLSLILLLPWLMMTSLGGFHNSSAVIVWSALCPLGALVLQEWRHAAGWFTAFLALLASSPFVPWPFTVVPLSPPLVAAFYVMNIGSVLTIVFIMLAYFVTQKNLFQRQALLAESARRFRTISEALAVPVVVADIRDSAIRYANPAALALLGLPGDRPLQATLGDFILGPDVLSTTIETALQGSIHHRRATLHRRDGMEVPVNLSARLLEFDGAQCVVLGLVDLTEQQLAQAEIGRQREMIHQAEKLGALGSLLSGVAHELNNPLSVVLGQATLLEEAAQDPRTIRYSTKIRGAAERCARIVKTFLAMARQRPPSRAAVDVNQVVTAAVELVGYGLQTAGIELRQDLDPRLPPVWADPDQIGQVLTNLIVNAQQAMADWDGRRQLVLKTDFAAAEGMVRISIRDSGPGVSDKVKARIFEPFFTTKPIGLGTGIGLYVCLGIVNSHGGAIQVENAPGGGACFTVRLPVGSMAPETVDPTPEPVTGPGRRSVLIVDDEPEVADTLAEMLSQAGYRTETAEGGRAALARLRAARFDVVVSDIRMPYIDGPTLYRHLMAERPALARAFIVVTGDTLSPGIREFLDKTGLPCIEKPFIPAEVRRLVAATLAGTPLDAAEELPV